VPRRNRGTLANLDAKKAKKLLELLEADCRSHSKEDLKALSQIIAGGPSARNAAARIKAIELRIAYGFGRPRQSVDVKTEGKQVIKIKVERQ